MGILCHPKELGFYISILEDFEAFKSGDAPSQDWHFTNITPATVGGGAWLEIESDEESISVDQARNKDDRNKKSDGRGVVLQYLRGKT